MLPQLSGSLDVGIESPPKWACHSNICGSNCEAQTEERGAPACQPLESTDITLAEPVDLAAQDAQALKVSTVRT